MASHFTPGLETMELSYFLSAMIAVGNLFPLKKSVRSDTTKGRHRHYYWRRRRRRRFCRFCRHRRYYWRRGRLDLKVKNGDAKDLHRGTGSRPGNVHFFKIYQAGWETLDLLALVYFPSQAAP